MGKQTGIAGEKLLNLLPFTDLVRLPRKV